MNTDIRIAIDFWQHPKTKKLIRRVGIEGIRSLQILWTWAANNKSDGDLAGLDEEDIELAAELAAHDKKSVGGAVEAVFVNEIGNFEIKALPFGERLALARTAYK